MAHAVVAVHGLVFVALIVQVTQTPAARLSGNDAVRYDEIARQLNTGHGGAIEYPPGAALLIRAIAGDVRNVSLVWLVAQCAYDLYCAAQARATSPATSENELPLTSIITSSIVPVNAKGDS